MVLSKWRKSVQNQAYVFLLQRLQSYTITTIFTCVLFCTTKKQEANVKRSKLKKIKTERVKSIIFLVKRQKKDELRSIVMREIVEKGD